MVIFRGFCQVFLHVGFQHNKRKIRLICTWKKEKKEYERIDVYLSIDVCVVGGERKKEETESRKRRRLKHRQLSWQLSAVKVWSSLSPSTVEESIDNIRAEGGTYTSMSGVQSLDLIEVLSDEHFVNIYLNKEQFFIYIAYETINKFLW